MFDEVKERVQEAWEREPLAIVAAVAVVIEVLVASLPLFGVPMTVEQQAAIMTLVASVVGLAKLLIVRPKVTPVANPHAADGSMAVIKSLPPAASHIRRALVDFFTLDEIYTLAQDVFGLDPDEIAGATRSAVARELTIYAEDRVELDVLAEAIRTARPEVMEL